MRARAATAPRHFTTRWFSCTDIWASLSPQSDTDVRLVDTQLALARQGSATNAYVLPAAAVLIAIATTSWVAPWRAAAWAALVTTTCVISEVLHQLLLRHSDGSRAAIVRRAQVYVQTCVAMAAAWASMMLFLWAPGVEINHLLLVMIVACTLAGWTTIGSVHLATMRLTLPVFFIFLVVPLLVMGTSLDMVLAFLSAGFWVMMAVHSLANYDTTSRMLALERERGELIEDLRRAKEVSDHARARAEMASRAKSAFLANMSHELRTPLNAILGFSEIIQSRAIGSTLEQYGEYGSYIHDSGQHLLHLINDILDLAKIESGKLVLRESEFDLTRLFDDAIQMMAMKAEEAGLTLTVDADPKLPDICGDERAMRQIVVNLVSNAIKFTPAGGSVVIFAHLLEDGGACFGVEDTGVGIAVEDQTEVFESFGQGRHDAIVADKGTGLGLPIVKGLAESHGGRVELESAPGEGTRVTVFLPAGRLKRTPHLRAAS